MEEMMQEGSGVAAIHGMTAPIAPFPRFTTTGLNNIRHVYDALTPSRETLGVLFALDAAQTSPSDQWIRFFVETASSQLIWDERPTGTITDEAATWVLTKFDESPSFAVLAILVRIAEEAHQAPARFAGEVRQRAALFSNLVDRQTALQRSRNASHLRLVA